MKLQNEPAIVSDTRDKILDTFKDLQFDEKEHRYYINGVEYKSVSETIHKFSQPDGDWNMIAENYAKKHGNTAEYWTNEWEYNKLCASMTGTRVHSFLEGAGWVMSGADPDIYVPQDVKPQYLEKFGMIPFHNKERAGLQALKDMKDAGMWLVLNETKVYSGLNKDISLNPKNNFAGTFDMLYYYDGSKGGNPGFVICDWKTNASLRNDFIENRQQMMLKPFDSYYDEALYHYFLQFSCYQIPLEDIGIPIIARRLIWLKDDGTYEKIPAPDVTKQLRKNI